MALILNLAFVGVVIAGFALLYTSGFGSGQAPGPEPESAPIVQTADAASGRAPVSALPAPAPAVRAIETAELPPPSARAAVAAPGDGAGGPEEPADEPEAAGLADEAEEDADPIRLAALEPAETSATTLVDQEEGAGAAEEAEATEPAADEPTADAPAAEAVSELSAEASTETSAAEEPPVLGAAPVAADDGPPTPRLAPRVAMTTASSAAPAPDSIAGLWSAAGQLAANLQSEFPCSRFSLQADSRGGPTIQARVGFSEDIERVRSRVNENFENQSVVEVGLGCTTVIGGGYVGLSDSNGRVAMFDRDSLSREIRAVLPGEGTCAVIGQVVATQPPLLQTLSAGGEPSTWVRSGGEPALCEATADGMWQVTPARNAGGRRAAVLMLNDDLTALDARRAVNLGPPAETAPAPAAAFNLNTASSQPAASATSSTLDVAALSPAAPAAVAPTQGGGAPVEISPLEGPAPRLPPGVEPSSDGYAVTLAFTVSAEGRASDLSVVSAGMAGLPVVAAALDVVTSSQFPASAEPYRASHTVRFPSAEFQDLLARLSLATAEERNASPVWDRAPTQSDYDRVYPLRALRRNINGEAAIDCSIGFDGKLECSVAREEPRGWGFGAAALELSEIMQASPRMSDNGPSANETVTLEFQFTAEGR